MFRLMCGTRVAIVVKTAILYIVALPAPFPALPDEHRQTSGWLLIGSSLHSPPIPLPCPCFFCKCLIVKIVSVATVRKAAS